MRRVLQEGWTLISLLRADIHGAPPLEVAVIPFRQIGLDLARHSEAGKITGLLGPQARADQHARDAH
nr:hypothetical protein [Rhodoferax sp. PAMC 29310]